MLSLKAIHLEREYNYCLDLLHSQFIYNVHDLVMLHKDKIAWYLLHLPKVLKVELVNAMIKRDIHNKQVEHKSEVLHDLHVHKYDSPMKDSHSVQSAPSLCTPSSISPSSTTSKSSIHSTSSHSFYEHAVKGSDWVTSYSAADKSFFYYNKVTGESTWECPDLSKHYEFVDWKIPEVQVVADSDYESPHSPLPTAKRTHEHHNTHNKHLVAHKARTEADSVETRPSTLVDANYYPEKKHVHKPHTLLERMRNLKIFTQNKLAEN